MRSVSNGLARLARPMLEDDARHRWRFVPKSLFNNDAFAPIDLGALPSLTFCERPQQGKQLRTY